jgi:pyruvate/2-oxoglutarate dehydrogenase complex dihydrolipoamide dehydrogenase (E3) component
MGKVRERKREIVTQWRGGVEKSLTQTENLELVMGEASFTGPHTISVALQEGGTRTLTSERIFVNTGTRNRVPSLDGLSEVEYLTNETAMELDVVPEHLVVLGGGYIALEFGQMFRRFGSSVTVLQARERLVQQEDADVSDEIAKIFREDGIRVMLGVEARSVRRGGGGLELVLGTGEVVLGSHLLVAVGRTPNTDALHLERAGVAVDERGFVRANGRLETTAAGVYVVGDVKGGPAFTHISYDDFRVHRTNLLEGGSRSIEGRMVPYTLFTDPELGRVGMTEAEARKAGKKIRVVKLPMSSVARAVESAEPRGFMKAVVDEETDLILGAAVLGGDGGEMMAQIQIAMMGGLTAAVLRDGIWAHPTRAEALNNLFK